MKKRNLIWLAAVFTALLAAGIIGVFLYGRRDKGDSGERIRVTAVMPHYDYGYWTIAQEGILAAGEEYEVDIKVVLPRLNYDVSQMAELIRQETAARVDALIAQGIEDKAYLDALRDAESKGILIVLIDADVDGGFAHTYVGTDNFAAGKKLGEFVAKALGGQGEIAILSGRENYLNLVERCDGIRDALKNYPEISVACTEYDQFDSLLAIEKYHAIARDYPEVDALVCVEGTSGQILGPRLSEGDALFEHIVAFDKGKETLEGLRFGAFDAILTQQQGDMGRIAVREIYERLKHGGEWNRKILLDTEWIMPEELGGTTG